MYHGVISIDKPTGMTSHDVVSKVRRILGMKKVGHTGTLDPEVTGVLPIVIGQATQLTEIMQERDKRYSAVVTLGVSTDTEDSSGNVIETGGVDHITETDIDNVIDNFEMDYIQTVPMYSSVKVNGKKLYEYAREGLEISRPSRMVHILSLKRVGSIEFKEKTISFSLDIKCSKGTYIRTLLVDIGKKLHVPAHMSYLRRTESCGFTLEDSVILNTCSKNDIIPIIDILNDFYTVNITNENTLYKILNGQKIIRTDMMDLTNNNEVERVFFVHNNTPIGIYHKHPKKFNEYKPFKMFTTYNDM